jgi:hypothetical protein
MPAATRDPASSAARGERDSQGDIGFADLVAGVADWATGITGRPTVIGAAARSGEPDDASIVLHPFAIQAATHTPPPDAVEASGRLLVFAAADDVAAAHAVTTLALTALAEAERDIDLTPTTDQTWIALGLSPRPSFSISGPVRMHVERAPVTRVRQPLSLRATKLRVLSGDLRSSDGTALTPGRVRLEPHGPTTLVGPDGRWSLPVPALQRSTLDITTKGTRVQHLVGPDDVDIHVVVDIPRDPTATDLPTPTEADSQSGKD